MHVNHYVDVGMQAPHARGRGDLPEVLAGGYQLRPVMFKEFFPGSSFAFSHDAQGEWTGGSVEAAGFGRSHREMAESRSNAVDYARAGIIKKIFDSYLELKRRG